MRGAATAGPDPPGGPAGHAREGHDPSRAARARALAAALTRAPARLDATVVGLLRKARKRVPVLLVSNATLWLEEDLAAAGLGDLAEGTVNSARVGVAPVLEQTDTPDWADPLSPHGSSATVDS
ncbi:hypothetical protein ACWC5I_48585, partial [Kitasatospora sp. NPDC001574]